MKVRLDHSTKASLICESDTEDWIMRQWNVTRKEWHENGEVGEPPEISVVAFREGGHG